MLLSLLVSFIISRYGFLEILEKIAQELFLLMSMYKTNRIFNYWLSISINCSARIRM